MTIELVPLASVSESAVERLLDRAFGRDRHRRTAYAIRAGTDPVAALSLAAGDAGTLVGTIQCWPVRLVGDDGEVTPLVMVGPVAVAPERQRDGVGRMLMNASLVAAAAAGLDDALMLIGDPEYYDRFFGFTAARTAGWRVPGPVERHRLLARGPGVPAGAGLLGPWLPVALAD